MIDRGITALSNRYRKIYFIKIPAPWIMSTYIFQLYVFEVIQI